MIQVHAAGCDKFYKQVAELLSNKRKEQYRNKVLSYIRTRVSFAMLKSISVSIHGLRDKQKSRDREQGMHLYLYLYLLYQYPGFYSYTEGATWKILDLLTETFLICSANMEIVHCPKNIFAEGFNSKQPPIPM